MDPERPRLQPLAGRAHGNGERIRSLLRFLVRIGSDIAEFGILGAIGTAVYQLIKKYNCHEPGCRRVGTHPAAGGQFLLCYHHHPDFHGFKPTHDLVVRMHREHAEQQAAIRDKLHDIHERIVSPAADKKIL
jgi:hypothetical protein